jgi:hypothetical protein
MLEYPWLWFRTIKMHFEHSAYQFRSRALHPAVGRRMVKQSLPRGSIFLQHSHFSCVYYDRSGLTTQ